jgi:Mn-dependent DtxR family transcriptional regulator
MNIHESAEDYLERILMLSLKKEKVHSIDIANDMGYKKPSISRAVKNLREDGYIIFHDDGAITLTEKGAEIAQRIYERHEILTKAFIKLGVDPKVANDDACKVEHDLSEETFQAIKNSLNKQ